MLNESNKKERERTEMPKIRKEKNGHIQKKILNFADDITCKSSLKIENLKK